MKKIIYISTVLFLLLVINGLSRSIYDLWTKRDVVSEARKDLEKEKAENQELKKDLSRVKTKEFIEEEARNKLFLTKPDEKVVIIPVASKSAEKKEAPKPNWQKWAELFF